MQQKSQTSIIGFPFGQLQKSNRSDKQEIWITESP